MNYYVDLRQTYLASKLKFVRGYETKNAQENYKEHEEVAKTEAEATAEEEQEAPVPLFSHVKNNLRSIFPNSKRYINNQQLFKSNRLDAHKPYISNNFNGAISEHKSVLYCEGYDYKEFPDENMEAPLSEPFFTRRLKMLCRTDGFMLHDKLGLTFWPLLNCYVQ